jgi:hypothetical protein
MGREVDGILFQVTAAPKLSDHLLRPLDELEQGFRDFSRLTGARVAIGYDRAKSLVVKGIASAQFGTCYGYPINAGTYMGYKKELSHMIDSIYTDPKLDDQKLLTDYCRDSPNSCYVDAASIFFLTINNPIGTNFFDPKLMKVDDEKRLWYRGIRPFFAHGNGNTCLNQLIEMLKYDISAEEKTRLTRFNRRSKVKKVKWYLTEFVEQNSALLYIIVLLSILLITISRKM